MTKLLLILLTIGTTFAAQPNAVILKNADTNGGHADGGVFVKQNWSGSSYEPNNHNLTSPGLYLGGDNLTTNFLRVNQGVGTIKGSVGSFQGSLVTTAAPDWTYYENLSESYSSLPGAPVNLSADNNVHVNLTSGLNVFNVTASQFSNLKTLDFNGTGNIVFNVTGNLNSWGWSVNYNPNKIVFNFIDATSININQRSFTGSILAENATVIQSQNIDGFLLAKNWIVQNSVELHYATLPIPEPSSLFLGLIAGCFLFKRKRNQF